MQVCRIHVWPSEKLGPGKEADDGPTHGSTLQPGSCPKMSVGEDRGRREGFCCLGELWGWREGGRDRKCSISGDADNLL